MVVLPFLFLLCFILTLALKLLGGPISWWIVIALGVLFVVPIIILIFLDVRWRIENKNKKE
ncbi:MAG: hypothetical protein A3F11_10295 [Gammaproteobacteria bacterium RIFCSPHIGHO2_12_FULL_37_14]|nr:MAG: hypothetical protein A3F11_10295 [Gammaproteobacteria bacterium RIFCSPHIGHO2_12_FULL_37_14]